MGKRLNLRFTSATEIVDQYGLWFGLNINIWIKFYFKVFILLHRYHCPILCYSLGKHILSFSELERKITQKCFAVFTAVCWRRDCVGDGMGDFERLYIHFFTQYLLSIRMLFYDTIYTSQFQKLVNSFETIGNSVREKITLKYSILNMNSCFFHPISCLLSPAATRMSQFSIISGLVYDTHSLTNKLWAPADGIKQSWKF